MWSVKGTGNKVIYVSVPRTCQDCLRVICVWINQRELQKLLTLIGWNSIISKDEDEDPSFLKCFKHLGESHYHIDSLLYMLAITKFERKIAPPRVQSFGQEVERRR